MQVRCKRCLYFVVRIAFHQNEAFIVNSTCEDYIREKAEYDKKKVEIDAKRHASMSMRDYEIGVVQRTKRRNKK